MCLYLERFWATQSFSYFSVEPQNVNKITEKSYDADFATILALTCCALRLQFTKSTDCPRNAAVRYNIFGRKNQHILTNLKNNKILFILFWIEKNKNEQNGSFKNL